MDGWLDGWMYGWMVGDCNIKRMLIFFHVASNKAAGSSYLFISWVTYMSLGTQSFKVIFF